MLILPPTRVRVSKQYTEGHDGYLRILRDLSRTGLVHACAVASRYRVQQRRSAFEGSRGWVRRRYNPQRKLNAGRDPLEAFA